MCGDVSRAHGSATVQRRAPTSPTTPLNPVISAAHHERRRRIDHDAARGAPRGPFPSNLIPLPARQGRRRAPARCAGAAGAAPAVLYRLQAEALWCRHRTGRTALERESFGETIPRSGCSHAVCRQRGHVEPSSPRAVPPDTTVRSAWYSGCFSYAVCLGAGVGSMIPDTARACATWRTVCLRVAERCCRPSRPCL